MTEQDTSSREARKARNRLIGLPLVPTIVGVCWVLGIEVWGAVLGDRSFVGPAMAGALAGAVCSFPVVILATFVAVLYYRTAYPKLSWVSLGLTFFAAAEWAVLLGIYLSATGSGGKAEPPPRPAYTPVARTAAYKLFAEAPELRTRFVETAASAEAAERDGEEVSAVRDALQRVLLAASQSDRNAVVAGLDRAESTLASGASTEAGRPVRDAAGVVALLADIEPAYRMGQALMTEGHAAVEKVVSRASWHFAKKEYGRAATMLRSAAALMGLATRAPKAPTAPQWFTRLAQTPHRSVSEEQATAALSLGEAVAAAEEPGVAVKKLLRQARQELAAGRHAEAHWWASVALEALGTSVEGATPARAKDEGPAE